MQAPVWRRFVSFLLDLLLIDLVLFTPFASFMPQELDLKGLLAHEASLPTGFLLAAFFMGLIALLYFSLLEWVVAATPGMLLMGLVVGGERTWGRCVLRNLFVIPIFPLTILWLVEPLHLLWFKERLLERWSGTRTIVVVEV